MLSPTAAAALRDFIFAVSPKIDVVCRIEVRNLGGQEGVVASYLKV
jgi:hypothetical protein